MKITRLVFVGMVLIGAATSGCEQDNKEPREKMTIDDTKCEVVSDCRVKAVPFCCGIISELVDTCVNIDYAPPAWVDCTTTRTCAVRDTHNVCECKAPEKPDPDAPPKVCHGTWVEGLSDVTADTDTE